MYPEIDNNEIHTFSAARLFIHIIEDEESEENYRNDNIACVCCVQLRKFEINTMLYFITNLNESL